MVTDARAVQVVSAMTSIEDGAPGAQRPSFDDWYAEHFEPLVRMAYLFVGCREAARDLTQEAMVGVLRHWDRIERPDHYARRAVANACRSHQRRHRLARRHPTAPDSPGDLGADELSDALAKLTERQRWVVVLRYWADLPEEEIAAALGVARGTVASLLHRAHGELRKVIEA